MKHPFRNIRLSFDRSFSSGQSRQLMWLGGLIVLVYLVLVALSCFTSLYVPREGEHGRWYGILFQLLDPGDGPKSMTPAFAVIVAMIGLVLFGGMLISVMSNVLERRVQSYTNGETSYEVSNHVIVIGFNASVRSLLTKIARDHKGAYIVLLSSKESGTIRDWVRSTLSCGIERSLIVIRGIQTAEDDIRRLCLNNHPKEIYVLGEEDDNNHDANNLECVKLMAAQIGDKHGKIPCHVQIDSNTAYSVLQRVDFCETNGIGNELVFAPYNFNEIWAQKVIATVPDSGFKPLDGEGITCDSGQHVHLILIGANEMASSIAVNAAHVLHFPNFRDGDFETCSHITFIDTHMASFGKKFRSQHRALFGLSRWREVGGETCLDPAAGWLDPLASPASGCRHLGEKNFMDIQWEFISGDIYDGAVQQYLKQCSLNRGEITTIALCDSSSEQNAAVCLALPDDICRTAHQILVRQDESQTTIDLIKRLPGKENVRAFGMRSKCYEESLIADKYGKVINAVYNNIDLNDQKLIEEKWDGLSCLKKWASIYSANMLYYRLRSLGLSAAGFTQAEADARTAPQTKTGKLCALAEHNRWVTEKLLHGFEPLTPEEQQRFLTGWEEYGALKESGQKHACICSNEVLGRINPDTRKWDELMVAQSWNLYRNRQQGPAQ